MYIHVEDHLQSTEIMLKLEFSYVCFSKIPENIAVETFLRS